MPLGDHRLVRRGNEVVSGLSIGRYARRVVGVTDGRAEDEAGDDHPLAEEVPIKDDAEFGDLREFAEDTLKDTPVEVEDLRLGKVELTFVSADGTSAAYSAESEDFEEDDYEEVVRYV
jgi:GrpB-like predicted nucleotidyltransferase (UPF0157 family)